MHFAVCVYLFIDCLLMDFIPINFEPLNNKTWIQKGDAYSSGLKKKRPVDDDNQAKSCKRRQHVTASAESQAGCRIGNETVACQHWQPKSHTAQIVRLHHEIKHFFEAVSPTPSEMSARESLLKRISDVVTKLWSGAKVDVFGSVKTGLYLPSSDLDIVVFGRWKSRPLFTLSDMLVTEGLCTQEDVRVIEKATVPIIKLTDSETRIKVDISFNMTGGQSAAKLIQGYMQEFPALPFLVMVLKQFLYQRDMNDVYTGGLGSYSLILMIVSFFQLHCRGEGRLTSNSVDKLNYGVMLLEFLELYGLHFNYRWTGISVRNGGRYIEKTDSLSEGLYIEDPTNPDSDVARGSYNMQQVQLAFAYAYHALCNAVRSDDNRKNSTCEQFLCTNSILSCVLYMPHQSNLPDDCDNFSRQKLTSRSLKSSHRKHSTPHKKHKLNITR